MGIRSLWWQKKNRVIFNLLKCKPLKVQTKQENTEVLWTMETIPRCWMHPSTWHWECKGASEHSRLFFHSASKYLLFSPAILQDTKALCVLYEIILIHPDLPLPSQLFQFSNKVLWIFITVIALEKGLSKFVPKGSQRTQSFKGQKIKNKTTAFCTKIIFYFHPWKKNYQIKVNFHGFAYKQK